MKKIYLIMFSVLLLLSCKDPGANEIIIKQPIQNSRQTIITYVMDWEAGDYLPSSPANVVPFPWKGLIGSNSSFLVQDYKSSDGWNLVYNTFSPTASPYFSTMPPGGLYFALYNRYRGLLRFYLYSPPGWIASSSNIQHGLSLSPTGSTSSSMLNYKRMI